MQLKVFAVFALLLNAFCVAGISRADNEPGKPTSVSKTDHSSLPSQPLGPLGNPEASRQAEPHSFEPPDAEPPNVVADPDPLDSIGKVNGHQPLSVDTVPIRLPRISRRVDWQSSAHCTLLLRLANHTDRHWHEISASGGCSCLAVDVAEVSAAGIAPGHSVAVTVVYAKPKEPGLTPRSIQFAIDGSLATLPILVDWCAPVTLKSVRQAKRHAWKMVVQSERNWAIKGLQVLDEKAEVLHWREEGGAFTIELHQPVEIAAMCRLRLQLERTDTGEQISHVLGVPLRNEQPRSIPARLVCRLDEVGRLVGETRLYFPQARVEGRPELKRSVLISGTGVSHPLNVSQKSLGKTVLKVDFTSSSKLPDDALEIGSKIRFEFHSGRLIDCPFFVSKG